MEIEFSYSEADVVALALYRASHQPDVKRRIRQFHIWYVIILSLVTLAAWISGTAGSLTGWLVAATVAVALFYPAYARWRIRMRATRKFKQEELRPFYGPIRWQVTDEGIREAQSLGETTLKWEAIKSIDVTDSQIFVAFRGDQYSSIPRAGITSGDGDEFLRALQRGLRDATA